MNRMDRVVKGLGILKAYDNTGGDVRCDNGWLYAGPLDLVKLPPADAQRLTMLGWEFDEQIGRWGFEL